jgi:hypothetical protein
MERAGILEFDGGLPRAQAERQALDICLGPEYEQGSLL